MARRHTKSIDNVFWDGFDLAFAALSAGNVGATFAASRSDPVTLLRLRGSMLAFADTTQAPSGWITVSMGIIIVPDGSSTTVQYSPVSDDRAPWIWYSAFHLAYEEYVTDVISSQVASGYREIIDNKAMRRIRPDQELQMVVENTTRGSAMSLNCSIAGRLLQGN